MTKIKIIIHKLINIFIEYFEPAIKKEDWEQSSFLQLTAI